MAMLQIVLLGLVCTWPTEACSFANSGEPPPNDATHRRLLTTSVQYDWLTGSSPGIVPNPISTANNAILGSSLLSPQHLTGSVDLVDALLDFAKTQSGDTCYWSFQALPPPVGQGPSLLHPFRSYWDVDNGQWDQDLEWVWALGEVATSRLNSMREHNQTGSIVGALCHPGSAMATRLCKNGRASGTRCLPTFTQSEMRWPMAIAMFKVDNHLRDTISHWRSDANKHRPNIEWTTGGATRGSALAPKWDGPVPTPGDVNPDGTPQSAPWPPSLGNFWGAQGAGQGFVAKVFPCSILSKKFLKPTENYHCSHIAEGANVSTADEGYALWKSIRSSWPPTQACKDDIDTLNSLLNKTLGAPPVANCKAGIDLIQSKVPNFNCDATAVLDSYSIRSLCCDTCGDTTMPAIRPQPKPTMQPACAICRHEYDPQADGGGKSFAELPDSWVCPVCGAPKSKYRSNPALRSANGEPIYEVAV